MITMIAIKLNTSEYSILSQVYCRHEHKLLYFCEVS